MVALRRLMWRFLQCVFWCIDEIGWGCEWKHNTAKWFLYLCKLYLISKSDLIELNRIESNLIWSDLSFYLLYIYIHIDLRGSFQQQIRLNTPASGPSGSYPDLRRKQNIGAFLSCEKLVPCVLSSKVPGTHFQVLNLIFGYFMGGFSRTLSRIHTAYKKVRIPPF